jgi:hypothetical protein
VSYSDLTVKQLRTKRVLANWIIHNLRTVWAEDKRAPKALAHYRAERAEINAALREVQGIDPPIVRVGLKPLILSARRV